MAQRPAEQSPGTLAIPVDPDDARDGFEEAISLFAQFVDAIRQRRHDRATHLRRRLHGVGYSVVWTPRQKPSGGHR